MAKGSNDLNMLLKAKVVKLRAELDVKGSMPTINKQVDEITKKLANKPVKLKVELSASISDLNRQLGLVAKTLKDSKSFKPLKIGVQIDVHGSAEAIKKQLKEVYGTVEEFNKKYGQQLKQMQEAQQKSQSKMSGKPSSSGGSVPTNGSVGGVNITAYAQQLKDAEAMMKKSFGKGLFSSFEMKDAEGNLQGFIAQLDKANGVVQKIQYKWNEEANAFTPISQQTVTNTEKQVAKAVKSLKELDREILKLGKNGNKFWGELTSLEDHANNGTLTQDMVDGLKRRIKDEQVLKQIIKSENDDLLAQQKLIQQIMKDRNKDWNKNQDPNRRKDYNNLINSVANETDHNELKKYGFELQKINDLSKERSRIDKEQQDLTKKKLKLVQELRKIDSTISPANRDLKSLIAQTKSLANLAKTEKDFFEVEKNMSKIADGSWMIDFSRNAEDLQRKIRKNLQQLVSMGKETEANYRKYMQNLPNITKGNLGELERIYRLSVERVSNAQEEAFFNRGTKLDTKGLDVKSLVDSRDTEGLKKYLSTLYGAKVEAVGFNEVIDKTRGKVTKLSVGFASTGKTARQLGLELDNVSNKLVLLSDKETYNANRNLGIFEQLKIAMARVPIWMASMTAFYGTIHSVQAMSSEILTVDKSLTELKRVASDNINIDTLFQGAVGLSAELGNNIHDITNAMNDFARTFGDFNEEQLLAITKTATLMSNVSDLSAQEATNSLVGTMNAFNIEAEKSVRIVDSMNEVDNNYAVSTKQLAEGLSKSASTAKTFGVTMEENIGHVTAISSVTMESGNVIGNSLKTIYSRMTTLNGSIDTLERIGVAVKDLNGNVRPVNDILGDLAKKWGSLSDAQRQNVAVQVAGRYQLSRFLALMTNYDIALKATNTAVNSHGSALRENTEYMKSFEARINKLKNGFTELSLAVGDSVLSSSLITVIEGLASLAKIGAQLSNSFGALPLIFGATALAMTKMGIFDNLKDSLINGMTLIQSEAKNATKSINGFGSAMTYVGTTAKTTFAEGVALGMSKATGAVIGLKIAWREMLASTVIGAGFVALGFLLEKLIGKIAQATDQNKKAEEQLKSYQKTSEKTYINEKDNLEKLLTQYKDMSKARETGSFSTEKEEEYIRLQQEIATIFPNLIDFIDSKGRAHIREANAIDKVVEATERNIKAKKAESILNAEKDFKDAKKGIDSLKGERDLILEEIAHQKKLLKAHPDDDKTKEIQNTMAVLDQELSLISSKLDLKRNDINLKINALRDAFANIDIKINPQLKDKVEEIVQSLDLSDLNPTQLQLVAKNVSSAMDSMSKALDKGNRKGYDDARKGLIADLKQQGVDGEELKRILKSVDISYKGIQKATEDATRAKKEQANATKGATDSEGEYSDAVDGTNSELEERISLTQTLLGVTDDHVDITKEALATYIALYDAERDNKDVSNELARAIATLSSLYPDLVDGREANVKAIGAEIQATEVMTEAIQLLKDGKLKYEEQMTLATAINSKKRIDVLSKELEFLKQIIDKFNEVADGIGARGQKLNLSDRKLSEQEKHAVRALSESKKIEVDLNIETEKYKSAIDKLASTVDYKGYGTKREDDSDKAPKKSSGSDRKKDPISQYISDEYTKKIDDYNLKLEESKFKQESLTESSSGYRKELENQSKIQSDMVKATNAEIGRLNTRNGVLNRTLKSYGAYKTLTDEQKESYNKLKQELDENIKSITTLKGSNLDYLTSIKDIKKQISDSLSLEFENSINATLKKFDDEIKKIADKVDNIGFEIDVLQLTKPDDSTAILDAMGRKAKALRGERDLADAKIKELEKKYAEAVKKYGGNATQTKSILEQINTAKEELEDFTLEAMRAEREVVDFRASLADEAISTLKNYYSNMKEMAVNAIEAEKKALDKSHEDKMKSYDKEIAKINAVYDAKFKNMDEEKNKEDYQAELNEKNAKKSELVNKISLLSKDNSLEGKKKLAELQKELADVEKETSDFMKDRQSDLLKDQLEAQKEAQIREIEGGYDTYGNYVKGRREIDEEAYKERIRLLDEEKAERERYYESILNNERYWSDKREEFMKGNINALETELKDMYANIDKMNTGSFDNLTKSFKNFSDEVKKQVAELSKMTVDNLKFSSDNMSDKMPTSPSSTPSSGSSPSTTTQTSNKGRLTTGSFQKRETADMIASMMKSSYQATSAKIVDDGKGGFKVVGDFASVDRAQKVLDNMKLKKLLSVGHISRFDTGGFTGNWSGKGGKLGILDKKEIVLDESDTSNLLDTVKLVDKIKGFIPSLIQNNFKNQLASAGGVNVTNNYELNINIDRLNGDKAGANLVVKEIMTGMKKMGR